MLYVSLCEYELDVRFDVLIRYFRLVLTFKATRPPQSRVGHDLLVLFARLIFVVGLDLAHAARVEPIVRAHCDGHETEGRERADRGQQHLNPAVK